MRIKDYTWKVASSISNLLHSGFLLRLAIVAFVTRYKKSYSFNFL